MIYLKKMEVSKEEGIEFAKSRNCHFFEICEKVSPGELGHIIKNLSEEYLRRFPLKKESIKLKENKKEIVVEVIILQILIQVIIIKIMIIIKLMK